MEEIVISNELSVKVFDSSDYVQNQSKIYEYLKSIFNSVQNTTIRDYIDNLNSDIFLQDKKVFIYVLFENTDAVSFAIFSKTSNISVKLDSLATHLDFEKLGFATMLLRVCLVDLKQKNIQYIIANFEQQNFPYQNLLFSFSKIENMISKEEKTHLKFDIKNIDDCKVLQDAKKLII